MTASRAGRLSESELDDGSAGAAEGRDAQTTAGNYFVANYPPFSFWTPERTHEAIAALEKPPASGTPLGLYVHIPFCRKRCHFCYFRVYTDRNADQIGSYLDAVVEEVGMYAGHPFVGGRRPHFVYFGGGTPSYLSERQLEHLTEGLKSRLSWNEAVEITFECEPGTLQERKLRGIKDLGVTRLSLGVEHLDDAVLELNNRAHASKDVYRAYEAARAAGFPQINVDLIAGMMGETDSGWRATVENTIALEPDSVTIYQMEIPYNTTIYRQMRDEGKVVAPIADWPTKRRWVAEAFEAFEAAGYDVGSAYTLVRRNGKNTQFVYRDALWYGADLVGTGVASFSHVGGVHFQNHHDLPAYQSAIERGRLPIYRALAMTDEDRLVREFVLRLKLGRLDSRALAEKFGIDPLARFEEPLRKLADAGLLRIEDGWILLSREGLLRVDWMLHRFFLPQHRSQRYA